jgi:arsenite methyltransferase
LKLVKISLEDSEYSTSKRTSLAKMNYFDIMGMLGQGTLNLVLHPGGITSTLALVSLSAIGKNMRVLDVGCGTGTSVRTIRSISHCYVIGLDLNSEMMQAAMSTLNASSQLGFVRGDAHFLPFGSKRFDVVLSQGALPFMNNKHKVVKEMSRVVKDNGIVAHVDFYYHTLPDSRLIREVNEITSSNLEPYTREEWIRLLENYGLKVESVTDLPVIDRPKIDKRRYLNTIITSLSERDSASLTRKMAHKLCNKIMKYEEIFEKNRGLMGSGIFIHRKTHCSIAG